MQVGQVHIKLNKVRLWYTALDIIAKLLVLREWLVNLAKRALSKAVGIGVEQYNTNQLTKL